MTENKSLECKKIWNCVISTWFFLSLALAWNTIRVWIINTNALKTIDYFAFVSAIIEITLQIAWIVAFLILYHRLKKHMKEQIKTWLMITQIIDAIICFWIAFFTYTIIEISMNVVSYMKILPEGIDLQILNNVVSKAVDILNYTNVALFIVVTIYVKRGINKWTKNKEWIKNK